MRGNSHVRFGGRPRGKGPEPRAPRRAAHPTEDAKQITGVGEARNRTPTAVERTVPFGLITQSVVVLWYTHHGQTPHIAEDRRAQAPWYRTKTQPAYLDMIVKLRRTPHRRPVS